MEFMLIIFIFACRSKRIFWRTPIEITKISSAKKFNAQYWNIVGITMQLTPLRGFSSSHVMKSTVLIITNCIGPIIIQIISQIVNPVNRYPSVIGFFKDSLHLCRSLKSLRYECVSKIESIIPTVIIRVFRKVR